MIKDIAEIVKVIFFDKGQVLRWGGDEFVALLEPDVDEAWKLFDQFCVQVAQEVRATVSVGIVKIDLSDPIKKSYYRAVQRCYAVKEAGGNGVKNK